MSTESKLLLERVAANHNIRIDVLVEAQQRSEAAIRRLREALAATFPTPLPGVDVVLVGSIARGQCTHGSDIDFYSVLDTPLEPEVGNKIISTVLDVARELGFEAPLPVGPFAQGVARAEMEDIVLPAENLAWIMRRMTLLVASKSIYNTELHASLLRNLLDKFLGRERRPRVEGVAAQVWRLLPLGRMIVELRYRDTQSDAGLVHWGKQATLYRLEVASSFAALFLTEMASAERSREALIDELVARFSKPPLARLLDLYDHVQPEGQAALATAVSVSNEMLRLLGTEGVRPRLAANDGSPATEALRRQIEELSRSLRAGLNDLFLRDPLLRSHTESMMLF